jgi:hypothetical protein
MPTREARGFSGYNEIDDHRAGFRGLTAIRALHPISVMTRALVIPMVSVKRDQLEEKHMGGTEHHIGDVVQGGLDLRMGDERGRRRARGGSSHPPAPRRGASNRSAIYIAVHEGPLL